MTQLRPDTLPDFMPDLPDRVPPTAVESALEWHAGNLESFFADLDARGGFWVSDGPSVDTVVAHFAHPLTDERTEVFVLIDTITHMWRERLEHFQLTPFAAHGAEILAASFVLPRDLRATTSLLIENDRESDLTTDRRKWRQVYSRTRELSSRSEVIQDSHGGRASVLAMPNAQVCEVLEPEATGYLPHATSVAHRFPRNPHLRHHTIDSEALGMRMDVWAVVPHPAHGEPTAVIAISDGAVWGAEFPLTRALARLHDSGACAPTLALFFSPADPNRRAAVLGMSEHLPSFLVDELLPWAATFTSVPADPQRRAIAGGSLGGLAAADVIRRRPDAFAAAIVQSGSFWWPGADNEPGEQLRLWRDVPLAHAASLRVFHEVGVLEGHLRQDNRTFQEILGGLGVTTQYREYVGGHDYACWRVGILDGITALFPGEGRQEWMTPGGD